MHFSILRHKKIKYYLLILALLWSGVIVNKVVQLHFYNETSVNARTKEEAAVLLTKVYEGKLTLSEKDTIAKKVLSTFDADIMDAIKTEELFTIYAYTKQYDSYITVGEHKINLNLVCYYNETTQKTTFIVSNYIYNEDY